MEQDYYEKLTRVYKKLTSRWSNAIYYDGYTIFEREKWEGNKAIFDFLRQFENVPFSTFFKDNHIREFTVPEKFFGTNTVIITDTEVKIHYDFSLVIFFYLSNLLRKDLEKLVNILDSNVLQEKFGKIVRKDKFTLKYRLIYHEDIHKFLSNHIENYGFIFNLLTIVTIYKIDDFDLKISYPRISNILKGLDLQYSFDNFQII